MLMEHFLYDVGGKYNVYGMVNYVVLKRKRSISEKRK